MSATEGGEGGVVEVDGELPQPVQSDALRRSSYSSYGVFHVAGVRPAVTAGVGRLSVPTGIECAIGSLPLTPGWCTCQTREKYIYQHERRVVRARACVYIHGD